MGSRAVVDGAGILRSISFRWAGLESIGNLFRALILCFIEVCFVLSVGIFVIDLMRWINEEIDFYRLCETLGHFQARTQALREQKIL